MNEPTLKAVLNWAYEKGRRAQWSELQSADSYERLLTEYDEYRKSKGDEGVMF